MEREVTRRISFPVPSGPVALLEGNCFKISRICVSCKFGVSSMDSVSSSNGGWDYLAAIGSVHCSAK